MGLRYSEAIQKVRPLAPSLKPGSTYRFGRPLQLQAVVNDQPVSLVLDSGAMPSVVLSSTLESLDSRFPSRLPPSRLRHTTSFGGRTNILGVYPVDVLLPHPDAILSIHVAFLVPDGNVCPYPILLGEDAINVRRSADPSKPTSVKVGNHRQLYMVETQTSAASLPAEPLQTPLAAAAHQATPPCPAAHPGLAFKNLLEVLQRPEAEASPSFHHDRIATQSHTGAKFPLPSPIFWLPTSLAMGRPHTT